MLTINGIAELFAQYAFSCVLKKSVSQFSLARFAC